MGTDAIHRGAGQLMPASRRVFFSSELTAGPCLQEPMFLVDITCPTDAQGGVYNCMSQRRGCVRGAARGHELAAHEGAPSGRRVVRLHGRAAPGDWWPGVPAVLVQPLGRRAG